MLEVMDVEEDPMEGGTVVGGVELAVGWTRMSSTSWCMLADGS